MPGFRGGKVPDPEAIKRADKIREELVKEHLDVILKHRKGMSKNDALDEIIKALQGIVDWLAFDEAMAFGMGEDDTKTCKSVERSRMHEILNNLANYVETFKDEEGNHD